MMNIYPNIIVWNRRGAAKRSFASFIKDLWNKYDFSILVLLETKINGDRATKVIQHLCFDGPYRVDANGFAGSIWALQDSSVWQVEVLEVYAQYIHLKIQDFGGGNVWFLTPCYGRP